MLRENQALELQKKVLMNIICSQFTEDTRANEAESWKNSKNYSDKRSNLLKYHCCGTKTNSLHPNYI
jgi:hypothetical protein